MKITSIISTGVVVLVLGVSGCANAVGYAKPSAGVHRAPTAPSSVLIYSRPPGQFIEVGVVGAESEVDKTKEGGPMYYSVDELKKQAAKMGANGVINVMAIRGRVYDIHALYEVGSGISYRSKTPTELVSTSHKYVSLAAMAVWVPESPSIDDRIVIKKLPGIREPAWSPVGESSIMKLNADEASLRIAK